ncbi:MAG: DUF5050 domain-containing protein [Crocinitomicaceae bacterium]|nr:DUF5050 domain-containing protein [Crocinitomicaceae bacterium]
MDVDGSNFTTLYSYPLGGMGDGIDVDESNEHIYFTNTQTDSIYRMDLNGSNLTEIYGDPASFDYLGDVKIDLSNGHIYFSEWNVGVTGIFRVDINGTNEVTILAGSDAKNMKLDLVHRCIYLVDNLLIKHCILDRSADTTILTGFQPGGIEFDIAHNILYTTDMSNDKVISSDLTGGNIQELVLAKDITIAGDPLESPQGPILVFNPDAYTPVNTGTTTPVTIIADTTDPDYSSQWLDCNNGYAVLVKRYRIKPLQ